MLSTYSKLTGAYEPGAKNTFKTVFGCNITAGIVEPKSAPTDKEIRNVPYAMPQSLIDKLAKASGLSKFINLDPKILKKNPTTLMIGVAKYAHAVLDLADKLHDKTEAEGLHFAMFENVNSRGHLFTLRDSVVGVTDPKHPDGTIHEIPLHVLQYGHLRNPKGDTFDERSFEWFKKNGHRCLPFRAIQAFYAMVHGCPFVFTGNDSTGVNENVAFVLYSDWRSFNKNPRTYTTKTAHNFNVPSFLTEMNWVAKRALGVESQHNFYTEYDEFFVRLFLLAKFVPVADQDEYKRWILEWTGECGLEANEEFLDGLIENINHFIGEFQAYRAERRGGKHSSAGSPAKSLEEDPEEDAEEDADEDETPMKPEPVKAQGMSWAGAFKSTLSGATPVSVVQPARSGARTTTIQPPKTLPRVGAKTDSTPPKKADNPKDLLTMMQSIRIRNPSTGRMAEPPVVDDDEDDIRPGPSPWVGRSVVPPRPKPMRSSMGAVASVDETPRSKARVPTRPTPSRVTSEDEMSQLPGGFTPQMLQELGSLLVAMSRNTKTE